MVECVADQLFRNSGRIKLIRTFKFEVPKDFDFGRQIAAMRREGSGIFMDEMKSDQGIMKSMDPLAPGREYEVSIYSAESVTAEACYDYLQEEGAICSGGSGAVAVWSLLKDDLFEVVGPQKDCVVETTVLFFPGPKGAVELRRYNLGKKSFWEMNRGPFDDAGFYLDAYLFVFRKI